jgi:ribose transport system substrate-binding protein
MRELSVRIIFISLWAVAAVLLLVMLTQEGDGRGGAKIYNISVLMRTPGDRFMKGLDQAALEFNADLRVLSSYAKNDGATQLEYLQREIASTDAVIINPESVSQIEEHLAGLRQAPPIITAIQPLGPSSRSRHVGADDAELGRVLGEWLASSEKGECLILTPADSKPFHAKRADALAEALEMAGVGFTVKYASPDTVKDYVANCMLFAALDESLIVPLCESAPEGAELYGIGYDPAARQHLESGRLKGLAVYSEYDAGYLSLKAAVLAAENKELEDYELAVRKATAESMYTEPVINILFPVG